MKKITIEDNVPIPDKLIIRTNKYAPLTEMKVNQSAFIECKKSELKKEMNACRSNLCNFGRKQVPMFRYSFRTVEGGFRVWRIK